jgi:DNA-binding MarR family transcriptional regulator
MQGVQNCMTETRWLSDDEQRTWRAFLFATRLLAAGFERDMQRGAGMPLTYYEILSVLSDTPERTMQMSKLADALLVSPSRISHAVNRLEEAGWVRREPCPGDRRVWYATLTEAGFARVVAAAPCHVESVRKNLFDGLTPTELHQLREIGEKLVSTHAQ